MDKKRVNEIIMKALASSEKPIFLVTSVFYRKEGKDKGTFCGKYQAWNKDDQVLWLQNDGKGRMPVQLFADTILSIRALKEIDLIDNTNILHWLKNKMSKEFKRIK